MEINKQVLGIAAGVLGSLFVGYCIYFDHKRRVDPEYKKKVRDREYTEIREMPKSCFDC